MRISDWSSDVCSSISLGIALGVSAAQTPSQDERYNTWGYSGSGTADDPYVLGGAKPYVQSNMLKRYGAVATIEWQPSDRSEERRVGKECVSTCRSRWSPSH